MLMPVLVVLFALLAILITLLPAIIAYRGSHPHAGYVLLICLLCGWTVVGWIAALIWAVVGRPAPRAYASMPQMVRRDDGGEASYQRMLKEELERGKG